MYRISAHWVIHYSWSCTNNKSRVSIWKNNTNTYKVKFCKAVAAWEAFVVQYCICMTVAIAGTSLDLQETWQRSIFYCYRYVVTYCFITAVGPDPEVLRKYSLMWLNWTSCHLSFFEGCFPEPDFFVSDLEDGISTPAHDLCLEVCWVTDEVRRCCKAEGPDKQCSKKI